MSPTPSHLPPTASRPPNLSPQPLISSPPSTVKFSGDDQVKSDRDRPNPESSSQPIEYNPVSVKRNWLTSDIDVIFAVVVALDVPLHDNDYVNCNICIRCGVKEGGGELKVSGVSLTVMDMDGKCLSGKESMVIFQGLTVAQRRSWRYSGGGEEQKERYDEFFQRRKERKEKMERKERWVESLVES